MEYYSLHQKIPQLVMEASIFRMPYFVGKFLPALLAPELADSKREALISALSQSVAITEH